MNLIVYVNFKHNNEKNNDNLLYVIIMQKDLMYRSEFDL